MKLIIEDDEGHKTTVPFVRDEITVGRQEGNTIRLTERNVSRRHARFYRRNGAVWVEDLKSYNGIKINGDRIEGAAELHDGDLVQIGDFDLAVQPDVEKPAPPARTQQMEAIDLSSMPTAAGLSEQERDPSAPPPAISRREATSVIRVPPAAPAARAPEPTEVFDAHEVRADEAPRLVITTTELAGREFACVRTVLTVGRGDECDIVINHRSLSRAHCRIFRAGDGTWKVTDLGASNRLQVNDEEYAESALHSGDIIGLGHVKLRFVAPGEEYTFRPQTARRSPLPMLLGAGVLAAAVGGAVVFSVASRKRVEPPPARPQEVAQTSSAGRPAAAVAEPAPKPVEPAPPAAETKAPPPAEVAKPPPPDEVKVADEDDAQSKRINDAAARAEELVRKRDLVGAKRALSAIKDPGANVAYSNALRHVDGELENMKLVKEWSAPRKVPAGATLERLRALASDDRSIFRDAAAQIVARTDKLAALKAARHPAPVQASVEPKPAPAPAPDLAQPAAPAPEDKLKHAAELHKQGLAAMNHGNYEDALPLLLQATEAAPNKADYLYSLGSCHAVLNHSAEAAEIYRRFLSRFPGDSRAAAVRDALNGFESQDNPNK